jgi:hypothetical protein
MNHYMHNRSFPLERISSLASHLKPGMSMYERACKHVSVLTAFSAYHMQKQTPFIIQKPAPKGFAHDPARCM